MNNQTPKLHGELSRRVRPSSKNNSHLYEQLYDSCTEEEILEEFDGKENVLVCKHNTNNALKQKCRLCKVEDANEEWNSVQKPLIEPWKCAHIYDADALDEEELQKLLGAGDPSDAKVGMVDLMHRAEQLKESPKKTLRVNEIFSMAGGWAKALYNAMKKF